MLCNAEWVVIVIPKEQLSYLTFRCLGNHGPELLVIGGEKITNKN